MNEALWNKPLAEMTGGEFVALIASKGQVLLTLEQVAQKLQLCTRTVIKLVDEGKLPKPFLGELGRPGKNNLRWLAWQIDELGRVA